jgi:GTP-binding protein
LYTTAFGIRDGVVASFAQARFLLSVASIAQFPPDRGVEIAFAGRSNAGKSSAINAILARRSLARTGKTPGQTRFLNYFELGGQSRIVDLPGYGYARVAQHERLAWGPLLERLRERRSLRGLFLIVDARRGIGTLDLALIDWAGPERRAVHVLLAKADKLSRREAERTLREARAQLHADRRRGGERVSAQLFSAVSGQGVAEAQRMLMDWLDVQASARTGLPAADTPAALEEPPSRSN